MSITGVSVSLYGYFFLFISSISCYFRNGNRILTINSITLFQFCPKAPPQKNCLYLLCIFVT
jgi:hypothetical protein